MYLPDVWRLPWRMVAQCCVPLYVQTVLVTETFPCASPTVLPCIIMPTSAFYCFLYIVVLIPCVFPHSGWKKGKKEKKKSPSTMSNSHFPYSLGACSCFPGSAVLLLYNNTFRECSHIHFLPFLLMSCRLLPKGFINRKSRPRTAFWLVSVWRTVSYRFYANE